MASVCWAAQIVCVNRAWKSERIEAVSGKGRRRLIANAASVEVLERGRIRRSSVGSKSGTWGSVANSGVGIETRRKAPEAFFVFRAAAGLL